MVRCLGDVVLDMLLGKQQSEGDWKGYVERVLHVRFRED